METRHVRYFLAICDELNFTRAAKKCGIAQPSLTTAIQRMEREIGGAPFLRSLN
jgi:LysR family transcriptional regulator, hydrogen peroxide-inducible genes activator